MSKISYTKFHCDKCGIDFDVPVYESVNAKLNPELKEKLLSGELTWVECPKCHEQYSLQYPILYNDPENKFMVKMDRREDLIDFESECLKSNTNELQDKLLSLLQNTGFKQVGATSYADLVSKIVMLENGLDYRVGTLLLLIDQVEFENHLNENNDSSFRVVDAMLGYGKDKEIIITFNVITKENPEEHQYKSIKFNKKAYDDVNQQFATDIDDVYSYFFDFDVAYKYIAQREEADKYKKENVEFATLSLENGGSTIAFISEASRGKFSIDDTVTATREKTIVKGKIRNIYKMNLFYCPFYPKNAFLIA